MLLLGKSCVLPSRRLLILYVTLSLSAVAKRLAACFVDPASLLAFIVCHLFVESMSVQNFMKIQEGRVFFC